LLQIAIQENEEENVAKEELWFLNDEVHFYTP
jgi:hypothetical protein